MTGGAKAKFSLVLEDAQLADLIQFHCQNGTRSAVEVLSASGCGRLFFEGGQLIHAECDDLQGLNAVVVMLRWQEGQAHGIQCDWPTEQSVGMGPQSLLLHAAQQEDERAHSQSDQVESVSAASQTKLSRCAASEPTTCVVRRVEPESEARPPPLPTIPAMARALTPEQREPFIPGAPRLPSLVSGGITELQPTSSLPPLTGATRVVRLSASGSVQQCSRGVQQDLVDRVYYAHRLLDSLGELFSAGQPRAAHFRGEDASLLVWTNETTTGVEGRCEALQPLARKLGVK